MFKNVNNNNNNELHNRHLNHYHNHIILEYNGGPKNIKNGQEIENVPHSHLHIFGENNDHYHININNEHVDSYFGKTQKKEKTNLFGDLAENKGMKYTNIQEDENDGIRDRFEEENNIIKCDKNNGNDVECSE